MFVMCVCCLCCSCQDKVCGSGEDVDMFEQATFNRSYDVTFASVLPQTFQLPLYPMFGKHNKVQCNE